MSAVRVAAWAAVGAVVAWGLKALVIALAGGLGQSSLEGPLFFLGLLLLITAFAATGMALTADRGTALRILGVIGAVVAGMAIFAVMDTGAGAVVPESAGWAQEEAGLWATSVLTAVVLGAWYATRRGTGSPSA